MRVTRIWDQSGEARRKRHWALRRKRGTTLIEMVLYLGIAAAVMTFSFGLLREEQVRRERTALAAELAQITTAAQTYVAANYANIRDQLVNDTPANGELIKAYSIKSLVDQGYLPSTFDLSGTAPKSFVDSLQYGLAVRAVLRSGTGPFPPTQSRTNTLTEELAGSSPTTYKFKNEFINNRFAVDPDGNVTDDEIDLEILLVTISSDPCVIVPAAHGPQITSQSESVAVGYVTGLATGQAVPATCPANVTTNLAWTGIVPDETALMATGPFGAWKLPLEPYGDMKLTAAEFPTSGGRVFDGRTAVQAGRFVSLLSLQKRPPLSESVKMAQQGDSALRCKGLPPNSQVELECKQGDAMYADLSFVGWDSNNDGTKDKLPGLKDVYSISLATPLPGSTSAQIKNVLSLDCGEKNPDETDKETLSTAGQLTVGCPKTALQGLVVSEDATFNKALKVTGSVTAQSANITGDLVLGSNDTPTKASIVLNGENIEGRFVKSTVQAFTGGGVPLTVSQPSCPSGLSPFLAAVPMTYEATDLRAQDITYVTDGPSSWKVSLIQKVGVTAGGAATTEITNPAGAKLLVHTWCAAP